MPAFYSLCCADVGPAGKMFAAQAGRGIAGERERSVGDVLEQIKLEFTQLAEESNACQRQRDEYQHKCVSSYPSSSTVSPKLSWPNAPSFAECFGHSPERRRAIALHWELLLDQVHVLFALAV